MQIKEAHRTLSLYHRLPRRTNTDPFDLDPDELLDEFDVLSALRRQFLEGLAFGDIGLPTRQRSVFDFDF
jgi:hypothetical protein